MNSPQPPYPYYVGPAPAPIQPAPIAPQLAVRPPCWSLSHDPENRECQGCGFQNSCRDELNRKRAAAARPPVPVYYPQPPAPVYARQPQPVPQYTPQQYVPPQAIQPAVAATQAVPYGYGWTPDPLYYSIHAAPPPLRPQFQGETFFERVVKNAALGMMESFFKEMFMAVRQTFWQPDKVIDVTPVNR